jgi:diguanylate cyclase (GGDEF)-like protein
MRLDQVNARLRELSVKDSLTGLYNRYGYDSVIRKRYINDLSKSERDVIIFIDINRLKYINDTFGHLQGDMAIRTIGTVINECIPKEWVAIRYGGDEFLIFGALKEEPSVDYLCERLTSTIEKRGEELRLPYRLSASCGHLVTDPSSDMTLEQYVETADKYMYENKRRSYLKEQQ